MGNITKLVRSNKKIAVLPVTWVQTKQARVTG